MRQLRQLAKKALTCLDNAFWYATGLHYILLGFLLICGRDVIPRKLSSHGLYSHDNIWAIDVPKRYWICDTVLIYMHNDLCLSTQYHSSEIRPVQSSAVHIPSSAPVKSSCAYTH